MTIRSSSESSSAGYARSFRRTEPLLQALTLEPSEYLKRQVRFSLFPFEDAAWLIREAGEELFMFASDYPHPEGSKDPIGRFAKSLEDGRRDAELVSPVVAYLASPACRVTGEAFAAGFGRFARVFVGECAGWKPGDAEAATVESIVRHMEAILSTERYEIPINQFEEMRYLSRPGDDT